VTILAFDTACDGCSAAVWRDGAVLAHRAQVMARGQSEVLVPMIAETMAAAETSFAALDAIGVTVGPGAFTGLRIGLAAARAIGLAAGRPVVGVTTLAAIAAAVSVPAAASDPGAVHLASFHLAVVIDAKREDLYTQIFAARAGAWQPLGAPVAMLPDQVAAVLPGGPLLLAGDGAARLHAALPPPVATRVTVTEIHRPDARQIAGLAAAALAAHAADGTPLPPARPLYLRPPDVTLPRNGSRLARP